jgi:hypothetical protein
MSISPKERLASNVGANDGWPVQQHGHDDVQDIESISHEAPANQGIGFA